MVKTQVAFHSKRRIGDVCAIEVIRDVKQKQKRQKPPRDSTARTFAGVCLQRSHRCAQHNAVRNAHNLENAFAAQLGKALAPKEVLFVGDIPKTRNAKVMRRVVRAAYLSEKLGDTSALENPASLDEIKRAAASSK